MRATPASSTDQSQSNLINRLGADLAWLALLSDSGADVSVLDASGRVRFMGPQVRWWAITGDPAAAVNRMLTDLIGIDMGEERVSFARRAITEGVPVTVYSVVRGLRIRTIYRPIPEVQGESERLVLVIGRPADDVFAVTDSPAHVLTTGPVVQARVVDMGVLSSLTPRELEVLRLIGQGLSTVLIAKALNRSVKTVEAHRLSLGIKLKARNRVDLARLALRAGLTLSNALAHAAAKPQRAPRADLPPDAAPQHR